MAVLPLVISTVALRYLPDTVALHLNAGLKPDRWGSKYEILILPVFNIIFAFFMFFMTKISKKADKRHLMIKITYISGIFSLAIFNIILIFMLRLAFRYS